MTYHITLLTHLEFLTLIEVQLLYLKEISETINKCVHGVKAILIVLSMQIYDIAYFLLIPWVCISNLSILNFIETGRLTDEARDALNQIKKFLGKDATNNIILVLSWADKDQTEDISVMESDWNQSFRSFLQGIGNRWGISPNPKDFSSDTKTYKDRLREIKNLISSIRGVYSTEQHEKNQQEQEEAKRRKEEEKKAKQEIFFKTLDTIISACHLFCEIYSMYKR